MKLKWYGTATLLLESGGTRLLIDPYLRNLNPKLNPIPMEEACSADAIFITHPHVDHFSDLDAFTQKGHGVKRVYVSETGIALGKKNGLYTDCMVPMSADECYEIGPFTVKTYAAYHCKFDIGTVLGIALSPVTYFKESKKARLLLKGMKDFKIDRSDVLAFEISDGDKRVFVLGSAGFAQGVAYPKGCDLLVFPYQGRTFMHIYMRKFLDLFAPQGVLCDHFDDAFPPFTHPMRMKKFVPTVKKCLPGARAIVPEEGEWYEV